MMDGSSFMEMRKRRKLKGKACFGIVMRWVLLYIICVGDSSLAGLFGMGCVSEGDCFFLCLG